MSFAPELNVGGKYIFGASEGAWKPASLGWFRITFYLSKGSDGSPSGVNLALATIASYSDGFAGTAEGTAATPQIVGDNNLTYVDVYVISGGGGSGGKGR